MRILESLLILLVAVSFTSIVNILFLKIDTEYEDIVITYSRVLAYNILNSENIEEIEKRLYIYPNIVYISVNGNKTFLKTHEEFIVTIRGFILGRNGTINPKMVIVGVRP